MALREYIYSKNVNLSQLKKKYQLKESCSFNIVNEICQERTLSQKDNILYFCNANKILKYHS